jgi:hypothetical protein
MRTRHAAIAVVSVGLMSFGTSLMASVQASAAVRASAPSPTTASVAATATAVGSAAGLVLGMLLVLAVAGITFTLRTHLGSPRVRRTVVLPEVALLTTTADRELVTAA